MHTAYIISYILSREHKLWLGFYFLIPLPSSIWYSVANTDIVHGKRSLKKAAEFQIVRNVNFISLQYGFKISMPNSATQS